MPFRTFPGVIGADGTASIIIQQDNASVEWDIYQVSVSAPAQSANPAASIMTASMMLNGFFLCGTSQAAADTASGAPDAILSRSDTMTLNFSLGTPGQAIQVGIWYNENVSGTSAQSRTY
jgi:hypothetical protein